MVDEIIKTDAELYAVRRDNVVAQVWERWKGKETLTDEEEAATIEQARVAADATYNPRQCALDWEAATLRHLGYTGPVLWSDL